MTFPISVDWTRCDGHGLCTALAPELFAADPWGFPISRVDRLPADAATIKRVVACCPALALRASEKAAGR